MVIGYCSKHALRFLLVSIAVIISVTAESSSVEDLDTFPVGGLHPRAKRAVSLTPDEAREKKAPRGFLGLRGKKSPPGLYRSPSTTNTDGEVPSEGQEYLNPSSGDNLEFPNGGAMAYLDQEIDNTKRNRYISSRGSRLPAGFMGLRGKKVPAGFMGLRGKKAPAYFLGLRGKKDDPSNYDDLESLLQAMRYRYRNNYLQEAGVAPEKRAPRGFLGLRGKKSDEEANVNDFDYYQPFLPSGDFFSYDTLSKRAPARGFLGLRG